MDVMYFAWYRLSHLTVKKFANKSKETVEVFQDSWNAWTDPQLVDIHDLLTPASYYSLIVSIQESVIANPF